MTVKKIRSFPCSWWWWCRALWGPCQLDPRQPGLSPAPVYTVQPPGQQVTRKQSHLQKVACLRASVVQNYSWTDHISRLFEKKQITCSGRYCCQALCAHAARLMLYERYFWCWGFRWIYGLWQMIKQKNNKRDKSHQIPLSIPKALLKADHRFCLKSWNVFKIIKNFS